DSTKEEPEVDLGNITNSYIVPTTPNTGIHKYHPIDNVIGEMTSHSTGSKEVFDYILQDKIKLLSRNLKIQKMNIKFRGGLLGSRSL
ncbi:hypothetical protein Tco_0208743, partial [Tanacetum coccineum]